jgi:hypothetical protein
LKVSKSYAVGTVVLWQIKEYYVTGLPNKANLLPTVVKLSVFDNKSYLSRLYLNYDPKPDPVKNV